MTRVTYRRMTRFIHVWLCLLLGLAAACASSAGEHPSNLAPPTERSVLGPGDTFTLEIVGEKDLPHEYQVASDGTVDFPYVHTLKVADLEAQQVARLVRERLIAEKVLSDPSVVVQVKEYASRHVTVLGQVAKPGSYPLLPGMSLIQAISQAGGLTAVASGTHVSLTRKTSKGQQTVEVNVEGISEGRAPDVPLQAGDQIYVRERIF
ncbi:MAG TPA: polysaccharide biosynthesis/export family protein [Polyangiaceae bacterium]|nr:polysaccharide biosynthesis/export family protein [Polyangiaceae bacterium]